MKLSCCAGIVLLQARQRSERSMVQAWNCLHVCFTSQSLCTEMWKKSGRKNLYYPRDSLAMQEICQTCKRITIYQHGERAILMEMENSF